MNETTNTWRGRAVRGKLQWRTIQIGILIACVAVVNLVVSSRLVATSTPKPAQRVVRVKINKGGNVDSTNSMTSDVRPTQSYNISDEHHASKGVRGVQNGNIGAVFEAEIDGSSTGFNDSRRSTEVLPQQRYGLDQSNANTKSSPILARMLYQRLKERKRLGRERNLNATLFLQRFSSLMSRPGSSLDFPYIIHDGMLFARPDHLNFARRGASQLKLTANPNKYNDRIIPFQSMISSALSVGKFLLRNNHTFEGIDSSFLEDLVGAGSKVPLIFSGGDFSTCFDAMAKTYRNYPLFTFAQPRNTTYSDEALRGATFSTPLSSCSPYAVPSYDSWRNYGMKTPLSTWEQTFKSNQAKYPWEAKVPKAIWRGSTTGHATLNSASASSAHDWRQLPRTQLVLAGMKHRNIMDFGFTHITQMAGSTSTTKLELLRESNVVPPMKMNDYMMFRAIVDIDGNSWSSRFAQLLCMNSVVIKVDPSFVDSFFDDLMPWVHYIPVRSDLSDLFNVTAYAMSDDNQPEMENIIKAANDWCTRSQTKWNMALDALLRLLEYVSDLNASDYSWHNTWMADPVASSKGVVMTLVTVSSSSIVAEENVRDALLNIQ